MINTTNFQKILFYSIAIATLYLWGYWQSFELNILPYITVWDIIKFSAYPLIIAGILAIFTASFGEVLFLLSNNKKAPSEKKTSFFKDKVFIIFIILLILLGGIYAFLIMFISSFFYITLKKTKFLDKIQNDSLRSLLIYIFISLPFISYIVGKANAQNIIDNKKYQYTYLDKSIFKHIGHLNEYDFFIDLTNREIVIRHGLESLSLKRFKQEEKQSLQQTSNTYKSYSTFDFPAYHNKHKKIA